MTITTPYYHYTKNGQRILISEMGDRHLLNTIALYLRSAKKGIWVDADFEGSGDQGETGGGGFTLYGDEALAHLSFSVYLAEANRRPQCQEQLNQILQAATSPHKQAIINLKTELFDHTLLFLDERTLFKRGTDYIGYEEGDNEVFFAQRTDKSDFEKQFLDLRSALNFYTS